MGADNYDRAGWAAEAVAEFRRACRCDEDTALGDLLCNLRHYADREGLDFKRLDRNAKFMYRAEIKQDGGRCAHHPVRLVK